MMTHRFMKLWPKTKGKTARLYRIFGRPTFIVDARDHIAYQALMTSRFSAVVALIAVILSSVVAFVAISSLNLNSKAAEQARLTSQSQNETSRRLAEAAARQAEAAIEATKISRDNVISTQRAWVGPRNARSESAPEVGKPLTVYMEYQNTGREPAIETTYDFDFFAGEQADPAVDQRVLTFQNQCMTRWTPNRANVVFPSGLGGTSYTLSKEISSDIIDDKVLDGSKTLVLAGCLVYKTTNTIHRTTFCYFYSAKSTKPANWNICGTGNFAD